MLPLAFVLVHVGISLGMKGTTSLIVQTDDAGMKSNSFRFFISRHFQPSSFAPASAAPINRSDSSRAARNLIRPPSPSPPLKNPTTHLSFLTDFASLIRGLSKDRRNLNLLSSLDSILGNTHLLDSSTAVYVVDGLCQLKKLTRAKDVLTHLKKRGNFPDFFLYSLVFHCLVKDGGFADVESVWADVCGSNFSGFDASDFIIHVCRLGDGVEIENVCRRVLMGRWEPKQQCYVALVGTLCRTGACHLAIEVFQRIEEVGFELDDLTYIALFQALCRNGDLLEADLILQKLVCRKCKLDICIYGSFIYGLCKTGKFREAEKLFQRLIARRSSKPSPVLNLKARRRLIFQLDLQEAVPEVMAYEAYCRSLCSVGKVAEAELLLREMMRKRTVPEVCVFLSFIKALFRAGRADDAVRFYRVQRKKGLISTAGIVDAVIRGLCQLGRIDDALEILSVIENDGFVPDVGIFNCILGCYWKEGRIDEAIALFKRMKDGKCGTPDVLTYTLAISGLCENGNVNEAVSIFQEMIEGNAQVSGAMYRAIIKGWSNCGRFEESHKYLNRMLEDGYLVSYIGWKLVFNSVWKGAAISVRIEF
ncbi:hypothetical protein ACLOJK_003113 [Asimina triloba]